MGIVVNCVIDIDCPQIRCAPIRKEFSSEEPPHSGPDNGSQKRAKNFGTGLSHLKSGAPERIRTSDPRFVVWCSLWSLNGALVDRTGITEPVACWMTDPLDFGWPRCEHRSSCRTSFGGRAAVRTSGVREAYCRVFDLVANFGPGGRRAWGIVRREFASVNQGSEALQ